MRNVRITLVAAVAGIALAPAVAGADGWSYSSKGFGSKGWGGMPTCSHGCNSSGGTTVPKPPTTSGGYASGGVQPMPGGSSGNPASVPEPASMALLGSGLAMLAGRRFKRRAA